MVEKFQNSLNRLIFQRDRLLLAVSGGMDSILMCHLCHQAGINFGIAHCNFQLRGEASNQDEALVKELAANLDVPFFVRHFDTKAIQKKRKGSTQMLARELRYEWFEEIRTENDFQYIATAHHINDSIETVVYNLAKGTGIRGLSGIQNQGTENHIIRPLFAFTRNEIENLVKDLGITYREDASNADDKYARNKIRHHVIPVLKELNPSLEKTFLQTSENIKETTVLLDYFINEIKDEIVSKKDGYIHIDKNKLKLYPSQKTILFEILKEYHFNNNQIDDLLGMLSGISGKELLSHSHRLINDREFIIIDIIHKKREKEFIIKGSTVIVLDKENVWSYSRMTINVFNTLDHNYREYHAFDFNKIKMPLKLRRRQAGDYFYPFGMKGKKKLKKYFTDQKYHIFQKEDAWILESDGDICAILGDRMDDRFKVTETTKEVFVLGRVR